MIIVCVTGGSRVYAVIQLNLGYFIAFPFQDFLSGIKISRVILYIFKCQTDFKP